MLFVLLARNVENPLDCQCEILSFFEMVSFWLDLTFFAKEIYLGWILPTLLGVGKLQVF